MNKVKKETIRKETLMPFVVALIGALMMAVCVFLPYSTATEERAEWIDKYPDTVVIEEMDLTAADMRNISMAQYARIYFTMSEKYWHDSTVGIIYIVLVALIGGGALIAALFTLGRKPIGCLISGVISCGVFHRLNWDFIDRGVTPSDSYDWSIAHTLFPIAAVILAVGAVWMLVKKIIIKKELKTGLPVQAEVVE
jgi:hypothetical protein